MAAQVLRSEVEEPPKISKDETGLPIITGWLSRQVKQGEKFVPRFLKTKDKVLCSFQKDPSKVAMGEEAPRVKIQFRTSGENRRRPDDHLKDSCSTSQHLGTTTCSRARWGPWLGSRCSCASRRRAL